MLVGLAPLPLEGCSGGPPRAGSCGSRPPPSPASTSTSATSNRFPPADELRAERADRSNDRAPSGRADGRRPERAAAASGTRTPGAARCRTGRGRATAVVSPSPSQRSPHRSRATSIGDSSTPIGVSRYSWRTGRSWYGHLGQDAGVDEALEPFGEHGPAHAEVGAQVVEAAHATEHVAHAPASTTCRRRARRPRRWSRRSTVGRHDRSTLPTQVSSHSEPTPATVRTDGRPHPAVDPARRAPGRRQRPCAHSTRITFSPKVFIPLTMLCRDRCGYCTFAQPPARAGVAVPRRPTRCCASPGPGAGAGCHEALFTLGERPELRYDVARRLARRARLRRRRSTTSRRCAGWCVDETGLLPHANAGALDRRRAGRAAAGARPARG